MPRRNDNSNKLRRVVQGLKENYCCEFGFLLLHDTSAINMDYLHAHCHGQVSKIYIAKMKQAYREGTACPQGEKCEILKREQEGGALALKTIHKARSVKTSEGAEE